MIVSDSNLLIFSRGKLCATLDGIVAAKPAVSTVNRGNNMEQGIIADSVIFYVRQHGEETYQQVDEYDWLESEGEAHYRRFGGCVSLFKAADTVTDIDSLNGTYDSVCKVSVRFYIFGWDEEQQEYDILEVSEDEFRRHSGTIDYERHTIRENGVNQICLIKGLPQC